MRRALRVRRKKTACRTVGKCDWPALPLSGELKAEVWSGALREERKYPPHPVQE
jgi:hypothetical protein